MPVLLVDYIIRRLKKLSQLVLILTGLFLTVGVICIIIYFHKPPLFFPKWKEFQIYGVDVSKYQRGINWDRVKLDGIEFAIIKATEGSWRRDKKYEFNWLEAKKSKVVRGAYHYYHPSVNWKAQFDNITQTVYLKSGDLPVIIDIEEDEGVNKKLLLANLKSFLIALEKHYRIKPIIYTYESFYNDFFQGEFRNYNLWIANYSNYPPELKDGAKWEFWQYSEKGSIEGIPSYVDLNCFYGSKQELHKLLKR